MERANILFVAVIIAAVGFFALRFLSGQPEVSRTDMAAARVAPGGDLRSGSPAGYGRNERFHPDGWTDRAARDRSRPGGSLFREDSGRTGRELTRPGRSRARTILGEREDRGGTVGFSTGRRGRGASSGRVSIVAPGRERSLAALSGGPDRSREELIETLAAQLPGGEGLLGGDGEEAEDGEDVLLDIDSVDDTEEAVQKSDVHEPRYGEDGIELTPDSELAFPEAGNVKGDAGTITVEFTSNWAGADETNNNLVQIREPNRWDNRFELVKNGKYLRFIITDDRGAEHDISYMIDSWVPGERHRITPVWGDGEMRLYVDGRLVGKRNYSGKLSILPGTPMNLGAFGNYKGPDGTIHKITVYGRSRTEDEIAGG